MLDALEKRVENNYTARFKIFALTHKKDTGVRIYGKRDINKFLDIIVTDIRKDKELVYFTLKNYNDCKRFISLPIKFKDKSMRAYWKDHKLPVYYDDYSQYFLTSEKKIFFGIQMNQGQDREDEIKIGYCTGGHSMKIGVFSKEGFFPAGKNYSFDNLENLVKAGSGFFVMTHKESTGARIYDSEDNKNFIDIVVRQINKHKNVQFTIIEDKKQKIITLPILYNRESQREYLLERGFPIYYNDFSETELESGDKKIKGTLAIQRNQREDHPHTIVLGYNFPNKIQKGIYGLLEGSIKFIPIRDGEFDFFDPQVYRHYTHI